MPSDPRFVTRIASEETRTRVRAARAARGIESVRTTGPFLARVLERAAFGAGRVPTRLVDGGAFDA